MSGRDYCTMTIVPLTIAALACVLGLQLPTRPPAHASEDHAALEYNIPPVTYLDPATGQASPFFPIGWYIGWSLSEQALQEVYDNGCNTVLFAPLGQDDSQMADVQARLDQAQELGMKIVIAFESTTAGGLRYGKPETYGAIADYVAAFKDHPALLGWQLGDEMGAGVRLAQLGRDDWNFDIPMWLGYYEHEFGNIGLTVRATAGQFADCLRDETKVHGC